ncbi:MAG TPA: methionyl-tRNA formyltransferase [Vicinamibacterales bacterium]|nr:methionyl-tRNA formyltransferase [Vicinamibacterales bacterium]
MVIAFFGTPQFAVPALEALLASRHHVPLVVTQPDKRRDRGQKVTDAPVKAAARAHGVPVFQPERLRDPDVAEVLRRHSPDLAVVAAYGKLIPGHLLALPRLGMLNVHASLLPKYRGAAPVHRAIMNGESTTGVTIMQIVEALDAGDMLAKSVRAIGADDTSEQLEQALADDGAGLLLEVLDRLEAGTVRAEPQDESASTYAPRLRKEEGLIDWTQPARRIHDQVRGLFPWPHAYSYLDGARLIVWKTDATPEVHLKVDATSAQPGTIVDVTRDTIEVATGDGRIALTEIQAEGRRPMNTRDFLAGRTVRPGTKFGS